MAISNRLQNRRRSRGGRPPQYSCPTLTSETACDGKAECKWNASLSKCRKAPAKRISKKISSGPDKAVAMARPHQFSCPSLKSETDCAGNAVCKWNTSLSKCRKAPAKSISKKISSGPDKAVAVARPHQSSCPSLKSETDCAGNAVCKWNTSLSKCRKAPAKSISKKISSSPNETGPAVEVAQFYEAAPPLSADHHSPPSSVERLKQIEAVEAVVQDEASDYNAHKNNWERNSDENFLYEINYAPSNRSTCKHCKTKIDKAALRVTRYDIRNPFGDGDLVYNYHPQCSFNAFINSRCVSAPITWERLNGTKNVSQEDRKYMYNKIKEFGSDWEKKCKNKKKL